MLKTIDDLRIINLRTMVTPALLIEKMSPNEKITHLIIDNRKMIDSIIKGNDDRLVVIVGPCSIHDPEAALEYGTKLAGVTNKFSDELLIIMRVYFEKPRTVHGWKGLIKDPNLDSSYDINKGLQLARQLLMDLAYLGVPAGTEFLDSILPQYISDVIVWGAIGARTTESQVHRELASGLSMPVGFKNGTDGNIQIAIDAIRAAQHPQCFLSINKSGVPVIVETQGNPSTHIILRGASNGPNYQAENISRIIDSLTQNQLNPRVMIDCSHGNSNKDHQRQMIVADNICQQIIAGSRAICGVMIESNLVAGKQTPQKGIPLVYGQSITDACIDWNDTVKVFNQLANAVQTQRKMREKILC